MNNAFLPLVSIVTPAYNHALTLKETVESVLIQDYPRIEYIVVDDGSTDQTQSILDTYATRITVYRQTNAGQSAALNLGWSRSRGSYLMYLSADDKLMSNAVSRLVKAAIADSNISCVYPSYQLIDSGCMVLRTVHPPKFFSDRLKYNLDCPPGPGCLFRKCMFEELSGWNENFRQVPDFDFWLRACDKYKFFHLPEVLAQYRVHKSSSSFSFVSPARADEIVSCVQIYWSTYNRSPNPLSLSNAYLISAKLHAQSARYSQSFLRIYKCILTCPRRLLSFYLWWKIASLLSFGLRYIKNMDA